MVGFHQTDNILLRKAHELYNNRRKDKPRIHRTVHPPDSHTPNLSHIAENAF